MLIPLLAAGLMLFPDLAVRPINGAEQRTTAWRGQPVAVGIGYSMDTRVALEEWGQLLRSSGGAQIRYVRMPVLKSWASQVARPFMERAIARRLQPADQANYVLTTEADALEQALALGEQHDDVIFALLDSQGRVALLRQGRADTETAGQLARVLKDLR